MDLVLGLSVTSKDIRGTLIGGATGEGEQVDGGVLGYTDVDTFDVEAFLESLVADVDLHNVGLTWSQEAEPAAIKTRQALADLSGAAPVVAVPDIDATEALARGIADLTGHDFLVVCIVEPDAAIIATVDWHRVAVEHIDRADSATLVDRALAVVRSARPSPDAIFVLGSDDTDDLVSALAEATPRPVITATKADFALTRGAALASAGATRVPVDPAVKPGISQVRVLSSVLAAAVVAFVISTSLVVGLRLTPDAADPPTSNSAAGSAARPAAPPLATPAAAVPALARQPFAKVVPPPAPQAPPPAVISSAPPAYVPPPAPPPQPRLRDRIIEKIPLINRFR